LGIETYSYKRSYMRRTISKTDIRNILMQMDKDCVVRLTLSTLSGKLSFFTQLAVECQVMKEREKELVLEILEDG